MYSYEERKRAVELYISSGKRLNRTIAELGYPSHQGLLDWYKEYLTTGDLHRKFKREPRYSEEEKHKAVEHYYANGRNLNQTSRALGYVKRDTLRKWVVEELSPEDVSCVVGRAVVKCTEEEKRAAVVEFCARGGSSERIGNSYGVSHSTIYRWKKKLLSEECAQEMSPKDEQITPETVAALQREKDALQQAFDALTVQHAEMERKLYRMQFEYDVLEKAGEILKKEEGINLRLLPNREKTILIDALRGKYTLIELLAYLALSKSSYFYQVNAQRRPDKYGALREKIRAEFKKVNAKIAITN